MDEDELNQAEDGTLHLHRPRSLFESHNQHGAIIIAHIDLDCFYVQVERSLDPSLMGKPVAVVQYNPFGDLKSQTSSENRLVDSGSIIAVSYEARAEGVTRIMRGVEAKRVCPDILLVQVPTSYGKADLTIYRQASANILKVLGKRFGSNVVVERASIDEVYLDLTKQAKLFLDQQSSLLHPGDFIRYCAEQLREAPCLIAGSDREEVKMSKEKIRNGHSGIALTNLSSNSNSSKNSNSHNKEHSSDCDDNKISERGCISSGHGAVFHSSWLERPEYTWSMEDKLLLAGAMLVKDLRGDVFRQLGFTCSAGIAPNKMLAKLSSAMHKPNKQTLVPPSYIPQLLSDLPYNRIQGFGGKLGAEILQQYGEEIITLGDLLHKVPRQSLVRDFGEETAQWILSRARGEDCDEVQDRAVPISIVCSKSFRTANTLVPGHLADGTVGYWLRELAQELWDRMKTDEEQNQRLAKQLHVHFSVKALSKGDVDSILKLNTHKKIILQRQGVPEVGGSKLEDSDGKLSSDSMSKAVCSADYHDSRDGNHQRSSRRDSKQSVSDKVASWWEEQGISLSKVTRLPLNATPDSISKVALGLIQRTLVGMVNSRLQQLLSQNENKEIWGITYMGLSINQFEQIVTGKGSITSFVSQGPLTGIHDIKEVIMLTRKHELSASVASEYKTPTDFSPSQTPPLLFPPNNTGNEANNAIGQSHSLNQNITNNTADKDSHYRSNLLSKMKRRLGESVDIEAFDQLPPEIQQELLMSSYFNSYSQLHQHHTNMTENKSRANFGNDTNKKSKMGKVSVDEKKGEASASLMRWLHN